MKHETISTNDLSHLPAPSRLRELLQSLATLDAILSREWESRYYSFNSHWGADQEMGSMRDGCGNDFFALFNSAGSFLKGFDHESVMSPWASDSQQLWPGLFEGVPAVFRPCLTEPAFNISDTTFCIWRQHTDDSWKRGPVQFPNEPDPDGSAGLLYILDGDPLSYRTWAEEYYGMSVNTDAVRHVYEHRPLSAAIVAQLNPEVSLQEIDADLAEIGFPRA